MGENGHTTFYDRQMGTPSTGWRLFRWASLGPLLGESIVSTKGNGCVNPSSGATSHIRV